MDSGLYCLTHAHAHFSFIFPHLMLFPASMPFIRNKHTKLRAITVNYITVTLRNSRIVKGLGAALGFKKLANPAQGPAPSWLQERKHSWKVGVANIPRQASSSQRHNVVFSVCDRDPPLIFFVCLFFNLQVFRWTILCGDYSSWPEAWAQKPRSANL